MFQMFRETFGQIALALVLVGIFRNTDQTNGGLVKQIIKQQGDRLNDSVYIDVFSLFHNFIYVSMCMP